MKLTRDCSATAVPAGEAVTLPAGSEVSVMQSLGGSVTVRTDRGLFRIDKGDAGAIEGFALPPPEPARESAADPKDFTEKAVWDALKTCFDPEIPVNIVDLGLVYDLSVEDLPAGGRSLEVKMTLTAPGCGMGPVIAEDARAKIAALPGVASAQVHVVWDPVWNPRMISEDGRRVLGLE
jgi:probable FeS assembly SUF system protein SufT